MREVLRRQDLGPDADFFENGGNSLLAVDLMLRLENEIGRELPARVLDGAFTARRIAGVLEIRSGLPGTYPAGVVQIKEGTNGRPLFCLLGAGATFWSSAALQRHCARGGRCLRSNFTISR